MKYGSGAFKGSQKDIKSDIAALANPEKAMILSRFFKTAKGEYGEGDKFLGLVVPQCRQISKEYYKLLNLDQVLELLHSEWHEERQIALFMMVLKYGVGDGGEKQRIYDMTLDNTKYINNWDLVDCNVPKIVGRHIYENPSLMPVLDSLASSDLLWDKRIAIISTMYFTDKGNPEPTLRLVEKLLLDDHDLIQKANGWMLREVGKRVDAALLLDFIEKHYQQMPRTTLRYAIELFNPNKRARLLKGIFN